MTAEEDAKLQAARAAFDVAMDAIEQLSTDERLRLAADLISKHGSDWSCVLLAQSIVGMACDQLRERLRQIENQLDREPRTVRPLTRRGAR